MPSYGRVAHVDRGLLVDLGKGGEGRLALFPGADDAVQAVVAHGVSSFFSSDRAKDLLRSLFGLLRGSST
jgi:hypothetical protein